MKGVKKNMGKSKAKHQDVSEKLNFTERMTIIGETAAMVGQDIRNPLQAIAGELFLAKEEIENLADSQLKKNMQESLRSIEENVYYIDKIVTDLQDYTKPIKAAREKVDIYQVISDTLCLIAIPECLQVEICIENHFPTLTADAQLLKHAFTNLIQNAVQAMPKGGTLTISACVRGDGAEISVQDTGTGIPEAIKKKMFIPLVTTKPKGQGLGLAVVKRLVEAQGGNVSFESEVGKGAKFTIRLPMKTRAEKKSKRTEP
jgi:signal transduction histidine kinase